MFYNVLYCFIVLKDYFYIIIQLKKILLKKHVWSFCMGSLEPMLQAYKWINYNNHQDMREETNK